MKTVKFLFFRYSPAHGLCAIAEIDGRINSMPDEYRRAN